MKEKTSKELNITKWLEKTRWNFKGWKTKPERVATLKAMRGRVLEAAGVTIGTLNNAKSRGTYTEDMVRRMAAATATEEEGYRIAGPKEPIQS